MASPALVGPVRDRCVQAIQTFATQHQGPLIHRRLRLPGLIQRVPRSCRSLLTPDGVPLACGVSRLVLRLLQPSWASLLRGDHDLPAPLREALVRLDAARGALAHADEPAPAALPQAAGVDSSRKLRPRRAR